MQQTCKQVYIGSLSFSEGGMGGFPNHQPGPNPTISSSRVNPMTFVGEVGADTVRDGLIRAHGILMIIAWPILAMTAIFFASWVKPALPNGEWFQVSVLPIMHFLPPTSITGRCRTLVLHHSGLLIHVYVYAYK